MELDAGKRHRRPDLGYFHFAGLPGTAAWAIGLLVGINMLFGGSALIAMALHAREIDPRSDCPGALSKAGKNLIQETFGADARMKYTLVIRRNFRQLPIERRERVLPVSICDGLAMVSRNGVDEIKRQAVLPTKRLEPVPP